MLRFLSIIAVILIMLGGVAVADQAKARVAYDKATTAYNLQRFEDALSLFQRAYEEKQDPVFLFNIGQTQRQLGQYSAAARSYRAYLAQTPNAPNEQQVDRLIVQMDDAVKENRAKAPPVGTQSPAAAAPTSPPVTVTTPAAPLAVSTKPSRAHNFTAWAFVGAGTVVAAVGAGLAGAGFSAHNDAKTAMPLQRQQDLLGQAHSEYLAGYTLLGVGAAAAVTGAVLFFALPAKRHDVVSLVPPGGRLWTMGGGR